MSKHYTYSNIRKLLTEGFDEDELRRLSFDEPDFRPVYDNLAHNTGKTEIIDHILNYADQKVKVESLLEWAKKYNPARYQEFEPYYSDKVNSILSLPTAPAPISKTKARAILLWWVGVFAFIVLSIYFVTSILLPKTKITSAEVAETAQAAKFQAEATSADPTQTASEWRDVPASELENPRSDDVTEWFRATNNYAQKNGFVGGFPNFYEADKGSGTVYGTILMKQEAAEWQDVPVSELGNPPSDDIAERFRATYDYATRNGFVGGFPTFSEADYGNGTVYGTILMKQEAAEWRDVPASELGNPPSDDIAERFRATYDYATRNGFVGGFPTFSEADYGNGTVYGTILIK